MDKSWVWAILVFISIGFLGYGFVVGKPVDAYTAIFVGILTAGGYLTNNAIKNKNPPGGPPAGGK